MKSVDRRTVGLLAAILSATCPSGPAVGADHATPLSSTPKHVSIRGNHHKQSFELPDAHSETVMDASASAGHVSGVAASAHVMKHSTTRARIDRQLTQSLKSQTRIRLNRAEAPTPGVAAAPAPAPVASLYKFTYAYHYKDVPLWKYSTQSQLIRARGESRKLLYIRERNLPKLDQLGDTEPTVKADDATKIGLDDSQDATRARLAVDQRNEAPHREIHVDPDGNPSLAWAFVVRSTDRARPFARRYWVSARDDPKVLDKEDLIFHASPDDPQQGQVTGTIVGFRKSPLDPPEDDQGLGGYTVLDGPSTLVTDANGFFSFSRPSTFSVLLAGPYCTIINDAGPALVPTRTGNSLAFKAAAEGELAQVSAFKWVGLAHDFVKDYLPANVDRLVGLPTHVNIDDSCNAFFDPNEHTLNFFKSGDGCQNSAYCDVACHEFGHAVDDEFGGILDGGYSEGFGDALAILITRDSIVGRDFQGRGVHLRDAKDISTWPPQNPEVHEVGRIYGGFAWELIKQLTSKLGSEDKAFEAAKHLILAAAALNPKDTPDAVRMSFLVDGQNGSTFFPELAAAADSRNIPRPDSPGTVTDPKFLTAGVK